MHFWRNLGGEYVRYSTRGAQGREECARESKEHAQYDGKNAVMIDCLLRAIPCLSFSFPFRSCSRSRLMFKCIRDVFPCQHNTGSGNKPENDLTL